MNVTLKKIGNYFADLGDIPKKPGDPGWLPQEVNGKKRALVRCTCGELVGLAKHHIHDDGTVTGSFHHDGPGPRNIPERCGWHVMATLREWTGGDSPPLEHP